MLSITIFFILFSNCSISQVESDSTKQDYSQYRNLVEICFDACLVFPSQDCRSIYYINEKNELLVYSGLLKKSDFLISKIAEKKDFTRYIPIDETIINDTNKREAIDYILDAISDTIILTIHRDENNYLIDRYRIVK